MIGLIWAVASQVWFDACFGLAGLFGLASLGAWMAAERSEDKVFNARPG